MRDPKDKVVLITADLLRQFQDVVPIKCLGPAGECAGSIVFLASEELANYITGQTIGVTGGQMMP